MPYYRRMGEVPTKRHLRVDQGDGKGLLFEELIGAGGFSQESALLYHRHSPSSIVSAEVVADPRESEFTFDPPLLPRHVLTSKLERRGDPVLGRIRLLGNDDVVLSWVAADADSPIYRNAGGDELVYVQAGRARLETVFGMLEVASGDYVVLPTGTTHRWRLGNGQLELVVIEAAGHIGFPDRYLSRHGQLLEGSPFSERDLRVPEGLLETQDDDFDVLIRHSGGLSRHSHAHPVFDVIGWDGCLYPYAFSIFDFEPLVGSIHQPPPIHQTFAGPNFVVCSFVPRPFDFHPQAIKVPYHHANVDSDEVLFYSQGDFMSRADSGIGIGSITMHPAGFVHGPQPGSVERAAGLDRTEELAVMIDTFHRLGLSASARQVADDDYAWSWSGLSGPRNRT